MKQATALLPSIEPARLLSSWEQGIPLSTPRRALLLLGAAFPAASATAIQHLWLGKRDALLLALRRRLIGENLEAVTACPVCRERIEFSLNLLELVPESDHAFPSESQGVLELIIGEHVLEARPPTAGDLVAIESLREPQAVEDALLRACVVQARSAVEPSVEPGLLPDAVKAELSLRLSAEDPLADLRLNLSCPVCSHAWSEGLDVAAWVWTEFDRWARGLLREVHTLASSYGWTEESILSMSPARRRHYLELVSA